MEKKMCKYCEEPYGQCSHPKWDGDLRESVRIDFIKNNCPKNTNSKCEIVAKTKYKRVKAWADVSVRGNPFVFVSGPVAERYPNLMHIYAKELEGLIPVTILIEEKYLKDKP